MSRKSKVSTEIKVQAVEKYLRCNTENRNLDSKQHSQSAASFYGSHHPTNNTNTISLYTGCSAN